MPHVTFISGSEEETISIGEMVGRLLRPGDILGLDGELGAGKTRLVRGIAESLGVDPGQVSSPTYVLIHEYRPGARGGSNTHAGVHTPMFHMDAYRLGGPEELDSLGFDRVVEAFGITVIEWFERIAAGMGQIVGGEASVGRLRIEATGPEERRIDLLVPGAWATRAEWGRLERSTRHDEDLPVGWTRCPVTGRGVAPGSATFPFVDERARLADLGRWLSGSYVVSRELTMDDLEKDQGGGAADGSGQG